LTETKESKVNKEAITFIVCTTIVISTVIISMFLYNVNDRNNMAKNIETAIQKGIDPISVKCAYQTGTDSICMAYSMGKK
jgi:hypothetical protein